MTVLEEQLRKKKDEIEIQEEQFISDSFTTSFKKGDLTVIKGIGSSIAEKLRAQGFTSVEDIAKATAHQISLIKGIGLPTAEKFIVNAKTYLRAHKKNLATFSEPQISDINSNEEASSTEIKPWFEPKYNISRLGQIYDTKRGMVLEDEVKIVDENLENELDYDQKKLNSDKIPPPKQSYDVKEREILEYYYEEEDEMGDLDEEEDNYTQKDHIEPSEISALVQNIHSQISKELERSGFYIIKKIPELRQLFLGNDYLAIKLVRAKDFLDLIYIIPLKISSLKGCLVVSESTVDYRPTTDEKDSHFRLKGVLESFLQGLHTSGQNIFQNILNKGTLYSLIKQYLQLDISLKKTLIHETLFFHSGPLQYKFLIEPILIAQGTVGFTEKLIPFAYHKITNTHIIEVSQLSNFLDFIDQKYFLIENYTKLKTWIERYEESKYKFTKDVRNFSAPFMLFGFVFLSLLIFQAYSFLSIFISLGYGVIALYGIGFGYLYLKYHQQKAAIQNEQSTPYYQRKYEFKKTDLDFITEEFSPKLMEQFIYECVNKDISSPIITKVERENAEAYFSSKIAQKTIEENILFESEFKAPIEKKKGTQLNEQLAEKYSSFLED
ncbi:MAG: helix-hairpin-helix domain-containing protein [Promethearchaeota archaeon]